MPQEPIRAFAPEVRIAFEAYLNEERASARTLMNATKRAQYLHFLANPEQNIVEKDKIEKARLHSEKRRAIKEYCVDSRGQTSACGSEEGRYHKATSLCV